MERINIRIAKKTHRRLNFFKGKIGISHPSDSVPTLDEVINAGLDLLERTESAPVNQPIPVAQVTA